MMKYFEFKTKSYSIGVGKVIRAMEGAVGGFWQKPCKCQRFTSKTLTERSQHLTHK